MVALDAGDFPVVPSGRVVMGHFLAAEVALSGSGFYHRGERSETIERSFVKVITGEGNAVRFKK